MWGESRVLEREEETALARQLRAAAAADERLALRNRLAHHNLRLVLALAKPYRGLGLPFPDLVQEGSLGLLHAIERFAPERGVRFATYASWWIRQSLRRAVQSQSRLVRLPHHVDAALWRDGRTVPRPLSLDAESGPARTLHDTLRDLDSVDPGDALHDARLRRAIVDALADLATAEREVLRLRFGLDDDEPRTQNETARALGTTRARVRTLELRALARLGTTLGAGLAQAAGAEAAGALAESASASR